MDHKFHSQKRGQSLLHGGACASGIVNVHRKYLARLALATQLKILAINYHLAPQHPFPAAFEDAMSAYHRLLEQGYDSSHNVIAGDSTGGGLTLGTLVSLWDSGDPLPARAVLISSWFDLLLSGNLLRKKAISDPILNAVFLNEYAQYYSAGQEIISPLISPMIANFHGLPPILVQVDSDEILLDDSVRLSELAHKSGVDATLKIWDRILHVFQILPFLPEAQRNLDHITSFITSKLNQEFG